MKTYYKEDLKTSFIFLLPVFILTLFFIFIPVIATFINSLFRDIIFLNKRFVLFQNYFYLLSDSGFWQSLKFTIIFIIVSVPLEIFLGIIFTLVLNYEIPYKGFIRVCVLLPWAIPAAISARLWELIYNYSYGLANFLLLKIRIINEPVNWLETGFSAFVALVIADVWKTRPFVAIILLAGLQAIPKEIYYQAVIDRANFLQRFFKITLPLLKPAIIIALLFRTIDAIRIFDLIYVLTKGGPGGATTSLSLYAYKYYITGDFGYASSISVILFIISFIASIIYLKLGKFRQEVL